MLFSDSAFMLRLLNIFFLPRSWSLARVYFKGDVHDTWHSLYQNEDKKSLFKLILCTTKIDKKSHSICLNFILKQIGDLYAKALSLF